MGRQRPGSVTNAVRVQGALVVVTALATGLTVLLRADLLQAWIDSNATARDLVAAGGMEALEDSAISVPSFVPVAVVSFVVYALLAWVILSLFRHGHGWARWSLLVLAVAHLFGAFVGYRAEPPLVFVALAAVAMALDLALVWFLLQGDTAEWVRGAELAGERERTG